MFRTHTSSLPPSLCGRLQYLELEIRGIDHKKSFIGFTFFEKRDFLWHSFIHSLPILYLPSSLFSIQLSRSFTNLVFIFILFHSFPFLFFPQNTSMIRQPLPIRKLGLPILPQIYLKCRRGDSEGDGKCRG